MDSELALVKFVKTSIKHNPDENGEQYNEEQLNLIETFVYSLVEKIHPKIFEKNITENKMKLKSKLRKSCLVTISLNPIQKLHYKLLYNIVYIKWYYPTKMSKFNLSEDLSELLDSEDKIINLYKEIKNISLN
jgi:hypothetical protein